MANAIVDGRTLVSEANTNGSFVGSTSPSTSTNVKIQGTGSVGEQLNDSERYVLFDAGSAQDWSHNVFYIWLNCGVVGLLETKALGGMKIRFAGPAVTDFIEFEVGGSDDWPTAVEGGWVQFVVDIEATPTNTGGTPPATTAIQHVGYAAVTVPMTVVGDNMWIDEIRRLPDGSPGITVQGRNAGTTDWTWDDLPAQLGVGVGTAKNGPAGSVILNTSVQFFLDDASTHAFTDGPKTVIWDDQEFMPTDLLGITILGAATGTANFSLGTKTGTGDDATGALGTTFLAGAAAVRWFWDSDIANIDSCNLYGCVFNHAGDIQVDSAANSLIGCTFVDCTSATVSNAEILRCAIIDANTLDSVAFMITDDISDIVYTSFQFSDGHAIEIITGGPASQISKGNLFASYLGTPGDNLVAGPSGSTDAAVSNNAGAARTITVTASGDSMSVRNESGTPSTTVVSGAVTTTITVRDNLNALLENAQVLVEAGDGTGDFPFEETVTITRVTTVATVAHTAHGLKVNDKVVMRGSAQSEYNGTKLITAVNANDYDYTVSGSPTTPATIATGQAAITATGAVLQGLTNVSGVITASRVFSLAQPVRGTIKKSTASPYFKPDDFTDTVSSTLGLTKSSKLVSDE